MPTRIVIQQREQHGNDQEQEQDQERQQQSAHDGALTPGPVPYAPRTSPTQSSSSPSSLPRFGLTRQAARSLSSKNFGDDGDGGNNEDSSRFDTGVAIRSPRRRGSGTQQQQQQQGKEQKLSKRDTVASPRLLGYMLNFIASLVCMVSAIKFERNTTEIFGGGMLMYNSTSGRLLTDGIDGGVIDENVASAVVEDAIDRCNYFDVALIVGGQEQKQHRIFNPYYRYEVVRLMQDANLTSDENRTGATSTDGLTSNAVFNNSMANVTLNVSEKDTEIPTTLVTTDGDDEQEPQTAPPTLIPSAAPSSFRPTFAGDSLRDESLNVTEADETMVTISPSQGYQEVNTTLAPSKSTSSRSPTFSIQPTTYTIAPTNQPTSLALKQIRVVDYWVRTSSYLL